MNKNDAFEIVPSYARPPSIDHVNNRSATDMEATPTIVPVAIKTGAKDDL